MSRNSTLTPQNGGGEEAERKTSLVLVSSLFSLGESDVCRQHIANINFSRERRLNHEWNISILSPRKISPSCTFSHTSYSPIEWDIHATIEDIRNRALRDVHEISARDDFLIHKKWKASLRLETGTLRMNLERDKGKKGCANCAGLFLLESLTIFWRFFPGAHDKVELLLLRRRWNHKKNVKIPTNTASGLAQQSAQPVCTNDEASQPRVELSSSEPKKKIMNEMWKLFLYIFLLIFLLFFSLFILISSQRFFYVYKLAVDSRQHSAFVSRFCVFFPQWNFSSDERCADELQWRRIHISHR